MNKTAVLLFVFDTVSKFVNHHDAKRLELLAMPAR